MGHFGAFRVPARSKPFVVVLSKSEKRKKDKEKIDKSENIFAIFVRKKKK